MPELTWTLSWKRGGCETMAVEVPLSVHKAQLADPPESFRPPARFTGEL
jgi:hypothetical protein